MVHTFHGTAPTLSPQAWAAENVSLIGDVTVAQGANLWYGAVLRGDQAPITVGEGSNVQDNAVVHVSAGVPTSIGRDVTVGHGAIVHGATIEDECLIGMGAVLLNGCVIGKGSLVAAGSLVTQGTIIPPGSLAMGSPAKVVRPLTEEELEKNRASAQTYRALAEGQLPLLGTGSTDFTV